MPHSHHSLKNDLTKTILIWSASFFALLGIVFVVTFNSLENYILNIMADHRLSYQVHEFAKHLDTKDSASIHKKSQAMTQDSIVSAVLLIDASGHFTHVALSEHQSPQMQMTAQVDMRSLDTLVASQRNLHLFTRAIPGHNATLALVLDDRPIGIAILSTTAWTGLLMLLLILISIKALHFSLKRQLVQPVETLNKAIEDNNLDDDAIQRLENQLPDEASDILEAYDKLQHSSYQLKTQISNMAQAISSCFWWSDDGATYTAISNKSADIIKQPSNAIQGTDLWSWTKGKAQIYGNNKQLAQAIERGDEKLDMAYQVQHDEQTYWYGESITLYYDSDGKLDTIYGIINDISSRKNRQQEQAEQLELMHRLETTGTLVGGIAHEFNNALAGMNGNIFLIKQSTDDEQTLVRIKRIESLIERSASMIDSMLSFAKKSNVDSEPISLIDFFNKLQLAVLPALMGKTRLHLQWDPSLKSHDAMVLADRKKLQEVILNLLENANLAVSGVHKPSITIGLEKTKADDLLLKKYPQLSSRHLIHCTVQDNGCGMPDTIKERIFEPFFTTREVGEGTGLGLSMVYGYINQIGGAIDIESSTAIGSTFHIYLPRNIPAQFMPPPQGLQLGRGESILVVDDDKIFRESTCEVLQRMGYKTIEACDGSQAIQRFEQNQKLIRIILMDILMPNMTGTQASKAIRRISPNVPIIYLTAYDRTMPMEAEVYEQHAELINKPFRISALSRVIQKVLKSGNQLGLFVDPKK